MFLWNLCSIVLWVTNIFPNLLSFDSAYGVSSMQKFWFICGHTNLLWLLLVFSLPSLRQGCKETLPCIFVVLVWSLSFFLFFFFFFFFLIFTLSNFILEQGMRDRSNFRFFQMAVQLSTINLLPPPVNTHWFEMLLLPDV